MLNVGQFEDFTANVSNYIVGKLIYKIAKGRMAIVPSMVYNDSTTY